jgi:hypothetical protein
MKVANPNLALWLNCWQRGVSRASKKLFFGLFLFLVCFVVLQVIYEGILMSSFQ